MRHEITGKLKDSPRIAAGNLTMTWKDMILLGNCIV